MNIVGHVSQWIARSMGGDGRTGVSRRHLLKLLLIVLTIYAANAFQNLAGADWPLLLVMSIVVGAWLGDAGGGLFATGVACAAIYLSRSADLSTSALPFSHWTISLLALIGVGISAFGGALRRASAQDERTFSDAIIDSLPGVLYFYSENGGFLRWNRNLERASGYSSEEIAHLHPLEMTPDDDKARVQAEIGNVFDVGESFIESGLLGKDGTVTPYYFTGKRIQFKGLPCLVGVGIDMSQHVAAAARLQSSETSLARAQRIAHVGSWELDIASSNLEWSEETFRIFGMVPGCETVSYQNFIAHVPIEDRDSLEHAQAMALHGREPLNIEHRIQRPNGEVRWVHELAELRFDDLGHACKLTGTIKDITERKHAQLQLQEAKQSLEETVRERTAQLQSALVQAESADRLKSAFLATMSHELRTPLNSIIGFTGILLQSLAGPINLEQKKQLGMVFGSARHLLELINDVLDISKIEARQLQVYSEPFDLAPVVERVVANLEPHADNKGLSLDLEMPDYPIAMVGDRRRVEQVLINLVSNAIKFTEHGRVTLTVTTESQQGTLVDSSTPQLVQIKVMDSGIGIGADDLKKLFQPFHQVDTGLNRNHEGTGLGLAICSRLVELMGGRLNVNSVAGAGSTFVVTLPRSGGVPIK